VGDGVGESKDEEAALGGIVGPEFIALESEVVHLEEEGEGAVVAVFHFGVDAVAHGERLAEVAVHLAEELSLEVEEPLVVVVDIGGEDEVPVGAIEEDGVVTCHSVVIVVSGGTEGDHLIVDKSNRGADSKAIVVDIGGAEDIAKEVVGVEGKGEVILQEGITDLSVGLEFLADGPAGMANKVIVACGTLLSTGTYIGVDLADNIPIVSTESAGGTETEDERIVQEVLADNDIGEETEGDTVAGGEGIPAGGKACMEEESFIHEVDIG